MRRSLRRPSSCMPRAERLRVIWPLRHLAAGARGRCCMHLAPGGSSHVLVSPPDCSGWQATASPSPTTRNTRGPASLRCQGWGRSTRRVSRRHGRGVARLVVAPGTHTLAPSLNHLADQLVLGSNTLITLGGEPRGCECGRRCTRGEGDGGGTHPLKLVVVHSITRLFSPSIASLGQFSQPRSWNCGGGGCVPKRQAGSEARKGCHCPHCPVLTAAAPRSPPDRPSHRPVASGRRRAPDGTVGRTAAQATHLLDRL